MHFNFEELYKTAIFSLKMNRLFPDIPRDKKWFFQFILMQGSFSFGFFLILYCTIIHDAKNKDWVEVCTKGTLLVFGVVVTFKYAMILKHQDSLNAIIRIMKEDYIEAEQLPLEEQKLLMKYALKGVWVAKLWLYISEITAVLFPIKAVFLMIYYTIFGQFRLVNVVDKMVYPEVWDSWKNQPVGYIILFVIYSWYAAYAASLYMGVTPLGPIFMVHACGQLELLKKRIDVIFSGKTYDPVAVKKQLKYIVRKLQDIHSFVEHIQNSFQVIYELTLKGTSLTIPISAYMTIQSMKQGEICLEFMMVIFGCFAFTAGPSYYGDMLIQTSLMISEAIYLNGWEKHWDKNSRTSILIILLRTNRPVAIRSMFRTICLATMTDVFQQAYTIFNVLNATF